MHGASRASSGTGSPAERRGPAELLAVGGRCGEAPVLRLLVGRPGEDALHQRPRELGAGAALAIGDTATAAAAAPAPGALPGVDAAAHGARSQPATSGHAALDLGGAPGGVQPREAAVPVDDLGHARRAHQIEPLPLMTSIASNAQLAVRKTGLFSSRNVGVRPIV